MRVRRWIVSVPPTRWVLASAAALAVAFGGTWAGAGYVAVPAVAAAYVLAAAARESYEARRLAELDRLRAEQRGDRT